MKTDIQIARENKSQPIIEIAKKIGIQEQDLELYGNYKAKISWEFIRSIQNNKEGKLILVTAINPTPAGEGKTTTTIGLGQALAKLDKKVVIALREPSLGPCFGVKGGATGGGYSQVVPMEDINLHFTGDIHAITSAHDLLSALIDNHIYHGNKLHIKNVVWKRVLDLNDRALREIDIGTRKDGFMITVASEIMAILCLASDLKDLKKRLGNILIGYTGKGTARFVKDLGVEGSLAVLLKDAIKPNLVQTLEGVPTIIHGGPFANIAHGCNSVIATKTALRLGDYAVTEAGFGADLGAEKFFDIKCRKAKLKPSAVVLVATIRALKHNGDGDLKKGIVNLGRHIENINKYHLPIVVSLNKFTNDTNEEIAFVKNYCKNFAKTTEKDGIITKSFGSDVIYRVEKKYINELEQNVNALFTMKPLASIGRYEFGNDKGTILEKVSKYYKSIGKYIEREGFGKISLSNTCIKNSIAHGGLEFNKVSAFKVVPEILKNGIIINKEINWKGRDCNTYLVCGNILIDNIEYIADIIVKETFNSKSFYLHQVKEKRNLLRQQVVPLQAVHTSDIEENPHTSILENFISNVNKNTCKSENNYIKNSKSNITNLLNMKAVAHITLNEFAHDNSKKVIDKILNYYNTLNNYVERENFGRVSLSKSNIKNSMFHHWLDAIKVNTFKAIPEIIKFGVIINKEVNWKGRGYNTYLLCAPITIERIEYIAEAIIKETFNSKSFYLHQVIKKENLRQPVAQSLHDSDGDSPSHSILENFISNVNRKDTQVGFALCEGWGKGGDGAIELANEVLKCIGDDVREKEQIKKELQKHGMVTNKEEVSFHTLSIIKMFLKVKKEYNNKKGGNFKPLYSENLSIKEKILKIAKEIYRADGVKYVENTEEEIKQIEALGLDKMPICIAKTQYSFTSNKDKLGAPTGFTIKIKKVRVSAGAGFIVCEAGDIMTMPGLPKNPLAEAIDIDENGVIEGMM